MTQEEKARAYDEALERARRLNVDNMLSNEAIEEIFPELAESEDERIRKGLQNFLWRIANGEMNDRGTMPSAKMCQEWIAYLEKQKEQNGEDEDTDFTIYHPLKNGKGEYECIPYSFYGSLTSFSEDKDLIDFLRTCFYTEEECNEWIKQQKEQNEEPKIAFGDWGDKEKKEAIITCLKYMRFIKKITNQEYEDLVRWFEDNLVANVLEKDGWTIASEQTDTIKEDYYGAFLRGEMRGYLRAKNELKPVSFSCGHEKGQPVEWAELRTEFNITEAFENGKKEVIDHPDKYGLTKQKPADFPTTDEEVKEFLETHPKVEVPEKYETPDFVFSKQEYESHPIISTDTTSAKPAELDGKALLYTADKSYQIGFRDGVASVKPEWSEEDEKIAYTISNLLCSHVTYVPGQGTTSGRQYPTYAKERDWFERRFKFLRPQPKQEWSEDYDEDNLRTRFAFYTYKDEPSVLYLSNVFVEETSRNHGFGTRILKAAEKAAEAIGAITICLKVKQDSPANAWYRKHGYAYMTFEDGYDWLEKNLEYIKPKKSIKWSGDDELMIESLIAYLKGTEQDFISNDMVYWLESLKERIEKLSFDEPSWKPSEEQMEALKNSAYGAYQNGDGPALRELYEQLEKL